MNETQLNEAVKQLLFAVSAAAIDAAMKAYIAVKDVNANYAPAYAAAFTAANIAAAKAYPNAVDVNIAFIAHSHAVAVFEDKEVAAKAACDAAYDNPQNVSKAQAANLSLVEAAASAAVAEVLNAKISNYKSTLTEILNACENLELKTWAANKSWEEIYKTCHRGDWLLLLFKLANPNDIEVHTLTKGHCANTIRHLVKDKRSIAAIDAAISYGTGKIAKEQFAFVALDAVEAVEDAKSKLSAHVTAHGSHTAIAIAVAGDLNTAYSAAQAADTVAADAFAVTADMLSPEANTAIYTADASDSAAMAATCHAAIIAATNAINTRDSTAYASTLRSLNSNNNDGATAKKANQLLTANIIRTYIPFEKWNIL